MSAALMIAQFRWRLFSIAQRVTPNLFADKVDRSALKLQIEPEDMYNFIPSPLRLGSSWTGFCRGPRRPLPRLPLHASCSMPLCYRFTRTVTLFPQVRPLAYLEVHKGP